MELVVTAWSAFPNRRMFAVPAALVMVYLISLVWMARRPIPGAGTGTGVRHGSLVRME